MTLFKKILIPTDFSDCADAALDRVLELPLPADGLLTLLHVYQLPLVYPAGPVLSAELVRAAEEAARQALTKLKERVDRRLRERGTDAVPRVTTKLTTGSPRDEIIEESRQGYDLIVIATNGRSGWSHLLLGSVAERVVRAAPCPVLTIRPPAAARRAAG